MNVTVLSYKIIKILIPAIFLVVIRVECFSQIQVLDTEKTLNQYIFHYYTQDNGLPMNGATGLNQSIDGYIWISTFDGLVRFDGKSMVLFSRRTNSEIISNAFMKIHRNNQGVIWFGNQNGLFTYKNDSLKSIHLTSEMPSHLIECILHNDNKLYLGTPKGLCILEGNCFKKEKNELIGNTRIIDIEINSKGVIYIVTEQNGIVELLDGFYKTLLIEPIRDKKIFDITIDQDDNLWIGTNSGVYKSSNGRSGLIFTDIPGLQSEVINKVYISKDGTTWIGCEKGLVRITDDDVEILDKTGEFGKHRVTDIIEDHEGNIWIATYYDGVYCLSNSKFKSFSSMNGLNTSISYSVLEMPDSSTLIGTESGLFSIKGNSISKIFENSL